MEMTKEYLDTQLIEAQRLLCSGGLHEVDQAHNIIANIIKDRASEQALARVPISKPPNLHYEKDIKNPIQKIAGSYYDPKPYFPKPSKPLYPKPSYLKRV